MFPIHGILGYVMQKETDFHLDKKLMRIIFVVLNNANGERFPFEHPNHQETMSADPLLKFMKKK